jgi:hypothetical protein
MKIAIAVGSEDETLRGRSKDTCTPFTRQAHAGETWLGGNSMSSSIVVGSGMRSQRSRDTTFGQRNSNICTMIAQSTFSCIYLCKAHQVVLLGTRNIFQIFSNFFIFIEPANWRIAQGESTNSCVWLRRNSETTNKILHFVKLIEVPRAHFFMHSGPFWGPNMSVFPLQPLMCVF